MTLLDLPATFTTTQARSAGVHPRRLAQWRHDGAVIELSRGVFRDTEAPAATLPDLLAVSKRAPRAVVCTISAAAVHGLTDVLPREVHVAVSRGTHVPRISWPAVRVLQLDPSTHGLGVSTVEAAPGELVAVYDAARTVVDLLRMRSRYGHDAAYTALQRFLETPTARRRDLLTYAEQLGALSVTAEALAVATPS